MLERSVHDRRRWLALALLCAAESMVVVDLAIVNVALPAIQDALAFSRSDLPWVVIGYTLTFGGFLMLGGASPTFTAVAGSFSRVWRSSRSPPWRAAFPTAPAP